MLRKHIQYFEFSQVTRLRRESFSCNSFCRRLRVERAEDNTFAFAHPHEAISDYYPCCHPQRLLGICSFSRLFPCPGKYVGTKKRVSFSFLLLFSKEIRAYFSGPNRKFVLLFSSDFRYTPIMWSPSALKSWSSNLTEFLPNNQTKTNYEGKFCTSPWLATITRKS